MEGIKFRKNNVYKEGVNYYILKKKSIFLFDVDATLTPARQVTLFLIKAYKR